MRTNFNSRTSQEVRLIEVKGNRAVIDFNSRTSQEVRRYVLLRCGVKSMNFNSRTSQEVRQQILLLILTLTTIFALN